MICLNFTQVAVRAGPSPDPIYVLSPDCGGEDLWTNVFWSQEEIQGNTCLHRASLSQCRAFC